MNVKRNMAMSGELKIRVLRAPKAPLSWRLSNTLRLSFIRGWISYHAALLFGRLFGFATITSRLMLRVHKADGSWIDYGVVGYRVVTTVGVNAISTSFQTPASPGNFFYHGLGTGSTAEAVGDTALVTELTTQYNPDSTRATGTHVAGGSANIYRSVGTNTVDASATVQEHGILTQAATGGGSLLDRTVFAGVALASGDGLQSTYEITFNAGS